MAKDYIRALGRCELLCQLAEEAAELSQAALKLRRAIDGKNPTPKTKQECELALIEEVSDCALILDILGVKPDEGVMNYKRNRWEQRLRESVENG